MKTRAILSPARARFELLLGAGVARLLLYRRGDLGHLLPG